MIHKNIYLASVLSMMLFCLPSAAQGPDTSKPVWVFHNGATSPYATFDNLYSALNSSTYGTNTDLASNDIIELHGDVHEPDDFGNHPTHNEILVSLTIRSAEGEKYTVYSPKTEDASNYFMFGQNYKGPFYLTLTFEDIVFDNTGFGNSPYFLYVMSAHEDIVMNNVDIIGGGGITAFAGYNSSTLAYAYDNDYIFTNCSFKNIPDGVISLSPYKEEERVRMSGCSIEDCGTAFNLSGQASGYTGGGTTSAVIEDIKISGCDRCFNVSQNATCEINGADTQISGNRNVLTLGWNAVFTINDGIFSDNHTTGSDKVFDMSDNGVSSFNHSTTLTINGGSFIGNSTEEGGVFQQNWNGKLQLHGGYFEGNNTDRNGEVICISNVDRLGGHIYEYAEVTVSGNPVFDDGQYINLEKWQSGDIDDIGYMHDEYDLIQQMYKDGPISPSAHINISSDFGYGFAGTHELSFLVSGSSSVTGSDLDVFTVTNTGSTPVTTLIQKGTSRDGKAAIVFSDCTVFNVTRYGLQNGDSAIFFIYKETSPGVWTKVHSFSLTGKETGNRVSRTVNVSGTGNYRIVETDFNWKYEKTGTMINGVPSPIQGEGTATGNVINFEVHGAKIHHEGTEDIKKNIFKWRDNGLS